MSKKSKVGWAVAVFLMVVLGWQYLAFKNYGEGEFFIKEFAYRHYDKQLRDGQWAFMRESCNVMYGVTWANPIPHDIEVFCVEWPEFYRDR